MKVILYPRVSSKKQAKEGDSIDAQIRRLNDYCKNKNMEIIDTYTDSGKSASMDDDNDVKFEVKNNELIVKFNLKKRPGFQKLLQEASSKKFDTIIFYKWDRYARDIAFADLTFRYFFNNNIKLIPTDDSDDPLVSSIMQTLSRQEIVKMKTRIRQSRIERFEQGMMVGKAPFGYRFNKVKKKMEIDKRKADIVKNVFGGVINGIDYKHICEDCGLLPQQFYNIIKNKVYIGLIEFEGVVKIGNHEPIISEETFYKVNPKNQF